MKPCKFCQGTGKVNDTDFLSEKVYGLHNNVGEVLESYIEVERILNSEEEKLDDESYAALGFVYDGLKTIFKGKRK